MSTLYAIVQVVAALAAVIICALIVVAFFDAILIVAGVDGAPLFLPDWFWR